MTTKKVVFVEYTYYNGRGNWDRELIERLAQRGWDVAAICCPFTNEYKDEEIRLKDLGVEFHFVGFNKIGFIFSSMLKLYTISRTGNVVLYVPSRRLIPLYYPITRLFNVPIIFSVQGGALAELEIMPEFENLRKKKSYYYAVRKITMLQERLSGYLSNQIIVISKIIKNELVNLGVDEKKIHLMYYSIDVDLFSVDLRARKNIRKKYGISDNDTVICYLARLTKKVPTKLWSAEALLKTVSSIKNDKLKILFVGDGDALDYLREVAYSFGIDHRVTFAGFVPHCKVPNYLSASDLFWFVMRDPLPTYGLALQEAMSCENIVITNNSGSMKEIVVNGENGFLVDPKFDKMKENLEEILEMDSNSRTSIKKNARNNAIEKYSWNSFLPHFEDLLKLY